MAGSGSTTVDFGAWPGDSEATTTVVGQTGYVAATPVEAWLLPVDTADHTVDEHVMEEVDVTAYFLANGSFTIRVAPRAYALTAVPNSGMAPPRRLYGVYTVGWAWA